MFSLVYRDARQALKLRPAAASEDAVSVTSDLTGVNLFVELRSPAHAR